MFIQTVFHPAHVAKKIDGSSLVNVIRAPVGTAVIQPFSENSCRRRFRDKSALDMHGKGKGRSAKRTHDELSFHSLRHTAVTLLKEAGIPHAVVQELIGHDSKQMSKHYTHAGSDTPRKAAEALPTREALINGVSGH